MKNTEAYSAGHHSADEQICSCFGVGRLCLADLVEGYLVETVGYFGLDGAIMS